MGIFRIPFPYAAVKGLYRKVVTQVTPGRAVAGGTISSQSDTGYPWDSLSHTVDGNANLLVVAVIGEPGASNDIDSSNQEPTYNIDGVTWTEDGSSGQAMTPFTTNGVPNGYRNDPAIVYYLLENPNVGSGSIAFGSGNAQPDYGLTFIAINFCGVNLAVGQSGIIDNDNNSVSLSSDVSVTLNTSENVLVVGAFYSFDDDSVTFTTGGTIYYGPTTVYSGVTAALVTWSPSGSTQETGMSGGYYGAVFSLAIAIQQENIIPLIINHLFRNAG